MDNQENPEIEEKNGGIGSGRRKNPRIKLGKNDEKALS
jgi:hypothetical protein